MPPVTPKCEIVNSARAIAVGMHCAAMRASSIPEKIVSASGRAACVYLPDYTVAQFVGEVSTRHLSLRICTTTHPVPCYSPCVCALYLCVSVFVGHVCDTVCDTVRMYLCVSGGSAQVLGFPGPLDSGKLGFGPYSIPESQVFFATASSFAFVNIRPTTQGELYCLGAGVLLDAPSYFLSCGCV